MRRFFLIAVIAPCCLFSVPPPWSQPVTVFEADYASFPVVGVADNGDSVVTATAFQNPDEILFQIGAQVVFHKAQNVVQFETTGTNVEQNAISVNGNGNAAAVWMEQDADQGRFFLRSSIFSNNSWSNPEIISSLVDESVVSLNTPDVYLDADTEGFALWASQNVNNFNYRARGNRYLSGWQGPETLATSLFVTATALAGNPDGNLLAAWGKGSTLTLEAAYYNGTSWTNTNVTQHIQQSAFPSISVALNSSKAGMLLWSDDQGGFSAATFNDGVYGSEQPVYVPAAGEAVISGKVVIAEGVGNATALLLTANFNTNSYKLVAVRYTNGFWHDPVILRTTNGNVLLFPGIGVDFYDNQYIVWSEVDPNEMGTIYFTYYESSSDTWYPATLMSNPRYSTELPSIAVNGNGNATIAWVKATEDDQFIEAIYTFNRTPQVPQNVSGSHFTNIFLQSSFLTNRIRWTPSEDPSIVGYQIYKTGVLIGTVLVGNECTFDDFLQSDGAATYSIYAINSLGMQSDPVVISLP